MALGLSDCGAQGSESTGPSYEMDEFYFSDEKYAKVNDYLQQMYEEYRTQYEEEGENHTGAYELTDETLPEGQRHIHCLITFP